MCLTALKKGWCANISKSEHICFTFAFYNEVLKIRKTSPRYWRSQPSSKKPWACSSGALLLMLMNFYMAVNVL